MGKENFRIRKAVKNDCYQLPQLIQELAAYQKKPNEPKLKAEDIIKNGFEANPPLFQCYVAESDEDYDENNKKIVGYAWFSIIFTTWYGRRLYFEDIMVSEKYRKKGLGARLFEKVCQVAVENDCKDMSFCVLGWNEAGTFYKKYGATDTTAEGDWHLYYVGRKSLEAAAAKAAETD